MSDSIIFILFGLKTEDALANKTLILNVENPSNITLMDKFTLPKLTSLDILAIGLGSSASVSIELNSFYCCKFNIFYGFLVLGFDNFGRYNYLGNKKERYQEKEKKGSLNGSRLG